MILHRFLLFTGQSYYPGGGWSDFKGSYRTRDEAKSAWSGLMNTEDWYQIIDTENPPNPEEV